MTQDTIYPSPATRCSQSFLIPHSFCAVLVEVSENKKGSGLSVKIIATIKFRILYSTKYFIIVIADKENALKFSKCLVHPFTHFKILQQT